MRPVNLHLTVEAIVEEEVVGHPHPVRLHRVALAIVIVPYVAVIIVADLGFAVALHSVGLSGMKLL